VRDALDMRLIFQRHGDTLEFHFYGTHGVVKAFCGTALNESNAQTSLLRPILAIF